MDTVKVKIMDDREISEDILETKMGDFYNFCRNKSKRGNYSYSSGQVVWNGFMEFLRISTKGLLGLTVCSGVVDFAPGSVSKMVLYDFKYIDKAIAELSDFANEFGLKFELIVNKWTKDVPSNFIATKR